jgi:hypothetical protein
MQLRETNQRKANQMALHRTAPNAVHRTHAHIHAGASGTIFRAVGYIACAIVT